MGVEEREEAMTEGPVGGGLGQQGTHPGHQPGPSGSPAQVG